MGARKDHQIPWVCSYRHSWAVMWVQRIKPSSSGRLASSLNHWDSLQPWTHRFFRLSSIINVTDLLIPEIEGTKRNLTSEVQLRDGENRRKSCCACLCHSHHTIERVFPRFKTPIWAGEIPQRLRALIALADDPDSGPNSQTMAHNCLQFSPPGDSKPSSDLSRYYIHVVYMRTYRQNILIHKMKIDKIDQSWDV